MRDLFPTLPANFDADVEIPADNDIQLAFSLPGTVSDLEVKRFMDLAEATIAKLGTSAPGNQVSCAGTDQTACARSFVQTFGKRAFRRPLDAAEVDDLMTLYAKLRTDPQMNYGLQDALGIVTEAMLQSPGFLYRWERGLAAPQADGALLKFDNYEVASRLSYFVWNSMPDATLLAEADAGRLQTPDRVAQQAARLLADGRADATLGDFVTQWLELGTLRELIKDTAVYPAFKPELRDSMRAETVAFARDVLRGPSPTFTTLLTAPYTFVDAKLAQYYGVTADGAGKVNLSGTARLGLLTQGALMSVKGNSYRTSPVRRGKFILNRLLCQGVPPPPPNVVPELPPPDPTKTIREQMAEHRNSPSCAACHTTMDALGFAFEHFDGAGNYRSDENGHAIDASGSATIDGTTLAFDDATELAKVLASSPASQACFVRQWLRYATRSLRAGRRRRRRRLPGVGLRRFPARTRGPHRRDHAHNPLHASGAVTRRGPRPMTRFSTVPARRDRRVGVAHAAPPGAAGFGATPSFPSASSSSSPATARLRSSSWPTGAATPLTLNEITAPLEAHKAQLLFPKGIDMKVWAEDNPFGSNGDAHHNFGAVLTATRLATGDPPHDPGGPGLALASSISIDQHIGQKLNADAAAAGQAPLPFPVLSARAWGRDGTGYATLSWTGNKAPFSAESDPRRLFNTLFAGRSTGAMPDPALVEIDEDAPERPRLRRRRRSSGRGGASAPTTRARSRSTSTQSATSSASSAEVPWE